MPDAVVRFCNWCVNEAWLVREEVQSDAWAIYHSIFYVAQVRNGGHGQFAGNSRMKPKVLDDVEAGLGRLDLQDLLAIFRRFRRALEGDRRLKRIVTNGGGFGKIPREIAELDSEFFRSPDPELFDQQASDWLKKAPTVAALTPHEIGARQNAILSSNALLAQRQAEASRRSPGAFLKDIVAQLWDKTGLRRPGETVLDQARRRVAANPGWAWQLSEEQGRLIHGSYEAVRNQDHQAVDEIFAGFRDLHARYELETKTRWPNDIRMYASRLKVAGERLGRPDLLEQAADAFGRTTATGEAYEWDAGFDWRSLGQALVELARLDKSQAVGLGEALDCFTKAFAIDADKADNTANQVRDLLGRAEAYLVLAETGADAGHLNAAREAIAEARPLLNQDNRNSWAVVNAELLTLLPTSEVGARDRTSALRALDVAITRERENGGGDGANPMRLKRLEKLRATLSEGSGPS